MKKQIYTTFGPMSSDQLEYILVHEHIFTETGPAPAYAYLNAKEQDVVDTMSPLINDIKKRGITCLFDATPVGVGRRADIIKAVSVNNSMPMVIPTGVYREPWIPQSFFSMSRQDISDWMIHELKKGIEETGVLAGFIKLSAGDDGLTDCEKKIFRAACLASLYTGAAIGSHTISGCVAQMQVDIMEEEGVDPSRFVWIHAVAEADISYHLKLAKKGSYLEYDWANNLENDIVCIDMMQKMKNYNYSDRILISMDSGWYNPRYKNGGSINGYTHLTDCFLPMLLQSGFSDTEIKQVMHDNVFAAFGR
ncbi:MAG: phosphotriesterase family protein [Eubacteriales bacterium]